MTPRGRPAARLLCAAGVLAFCIALPPPALAHVALDRQIVDLTARIAVHPRDASLYLRRGELHRAHSDWDAAARDYERARTLDPHLRTVDLCMGRMLLEAGHPDRAIESLDRFLEARPDHPDALAERARALVSLGRSLAAARDFTRAIAASRAPGSPDPDLFLERARALAAANPPRLDEAIRGLDEGMAALGPLISLGFLAIELEVRLGRFDPALARLALLATRSARKEGYLVRRGEILETAARSHEARLAYGQALDAIAILPPPRRSARAVQDLASKARSGLARLTGGSPALPEAARREAR